MFCTALSVQHCLYKISCTAFSVQHLIRIFPVHHFCTAPSRQHLSTTFVHNCLHSVCCTTFMYIFFCTTFLVQHLLYNTSCTAFIVQHVQCSCLYNVFAGGGFFAA